MKLNWDYAIELFCLYVLCVHVLAVFYVNNVTAMYNILEAFYKKKNNIMRLFWRGVTLDLLLCFVYMTNGHAF